MEKKTQNYTAEQTLAMVAQYAAGGSVEAIALQMGKSVRSVVAKLSREGVYVAKSYVSKTGERPQKKDLVADQIAQLVELTESETESLTKANKTALAKILAALQ
jgi:transposase-like protein